MSAPEVRQYVPGKKITEPGIYAGVPIEDYHGDICDGPSISSSGLRRIFMESPADYFASSIYNKEVDDDGEPMREERPVSEALVLGKAAHHLLLGETMFRKSFVIRPEMVAGEPWQGNRKVCRAWIADAEAKGLTVLKAEHVQKIKRMARMLNREPLIQNGILRGHVERSFFWKDKKTGIWIKGRPDVQPTDDDDFVDYKTAHDISTDGIERAIGDHGYHIQGATIGLCWQNIVGRPMKSFNLVFQQSSGPHSVAFVEVKSSEIKAGTEAALLALQVFAHCLKTGDWFGPAGRGGDLKPFGRTPWAVKDGEYRTKVFEQEIASWNKKPELKDQA